MVYVCSWDSPHMYSSPSQFCSMSSLRICLPSESCVTSLAEHSFPPIGLCEITWQTAWVPVYCACGTNVLMFLVCGDWLWNHYWEDQERAVQSPGEEKVSHISYVQLLGGPETLHYTFCSIWMDSGRLPSPPRRMNVHHCLDRCLFLKATDGGMSLVLCPQEVSRAPHHFRSAQTCHPNSNPYSETDGDWDNAGAEIKVHATEKSNINSFFSLFFCDYNVGQSIDFHASPAARNVAFSGYSCLSITLCVVSGESDFLLVFILISLGLEEVVTVLTAFQPRAATVVIVSCWAGDGCDEM